jgi:hypothetical protein
MLSGIGCWDFFLEEHIRISQNQDTLKIYKY